MQSHPWAFWLASPRVYAPIPTRVHGGTSTPSAVSGFRPLDTRSGEIRPISLATSSESWSPYPVSWSLKYTTLQNAPPFIALSYVWGSLEKTETIQIDRQPVRVSLNLGMVLRRIQEQEFGIYEFWIDALCIDQNDNAEKSDQIRRMAQIYQAAQYVIAWLGEETMATRAMYQYANRIFSAPASKSTLKIPSINSPQQLEYFDSNPGDGLLDLSSRPYWRRVWILQEFAVARDVHIMCGSGTMQWEQFYYVYQLLGLDKKASMSLRLTFSPFLENAMQRIFNTRQRFHKKDRISAQYKLTLEFLLMQTSIIGTSMASTDPRDKIYALLGLSTDAVDMGIWPLYHTSWQAVYEDVAAILLRRCSLRILSCCTLEDSLFTGESITQDLPSWVPNWSSEIPIPLVLPCIDKPHTPFSASGQIKSAPGFSTASGHSALNLRAVWVDTVEATSLPWVRRASNSPDHYSQWLAHIEDLSKRGKTIYATESGWFEAVWRTSIADTWFNDFGVPRRTSENDIIQYQGLSLETPQKIEQRSYVSKTYMQAVDLRAHNKRVFRTQTGYLGIGSAACMPGDDVFILLGADVPFLLRRLGSNHHRIVGETYVHGIMDGEFVEGPTTLTDISIC
jgi:hypothetical protein